MSATTTKARKSRKPTFTATPDQVKVAAFEFSTHDHNMLELLRNAGGDKQDGVYDAFICGHVAGWVDRQSGKPSGKLTDALIKKAECIIGNARFDGKSKLKKGQGRRTKDEETALGTARKGFSRLLKRLSIPTLRPRKPNTTPKNKTPAPAADGWIAGKNVVAASPVVHNGKETVKAMHQYMAMMLAFTDKNKTVECPAMVAARAAVAAFAEAVAKLPNE